MAISLKRLFEEIYQAEDEGSLRSHLAPKVGEYFAAKRSGIFFFNRLKTDYPLQSILDIALSLEHNPVARYIAERHAPVHDGLVTTPKAWKVICPRPDHWHVMAGPIIDRGQVVGAVGCTRAKTMPVFDAEDLADLSALCLHLSAWTATVRSAQNTTLECQRRLLSCDRLTTRELEIANLVALGHTNAEIGNKLWITENSVKQALKRMFRKLDVSSRTEMVAQLSTPQFHLSKTK